MYKYFSRPPGPGYKGTYGYPPNFLRSHLILDHSRFLEFMRQAWQIEIDDWDLNILEYFGLVMPIRKANVKDVVRRHVELPVEHGKHVHLPTQRWVHARWCYSERRKPKAEREEPAIDVSLAKPDQLFDLPVDLLRPTPWLWSGYKSSFYPVPHACDLPNDHPRKGTAFHRWIEPLHPGTFFSARALKNLGRWHRPTDPSYWALMVDGLRFKDGLDVPCADWIRRLLGAPNANALRVKPDGLLFAQSQVTRFYVVGGGALGRGTCHTWGRLGSTIGQDWVAAALVTALRARTGRELALELEHALRSGSVNMKRQVFDTVARHWRRYAEKDITPLPPVIPRFHRDALLWLLLRNRGDVPAARACRDLGEVVEMTPRSVQQAAWAGRRALSIK